MLVRRSITATAVLALVVLLGACGQSAAPSAGTITVTMTDKEIRLSETAVNAGLYTFDVINKGTVVHSLVLMRTDVPHDKMPADPADASKVKETGTIAATGQMAVGASKQMSRQLAAGQYVIVCNEPAHYLVGMHVALVVK
ncbi:MAG TPA: sulfocyanin-like copper-binding protein [Candidatus Limnocylindria bacterium]|jgi:uncharacterized cupredoxin-like copper-binding protein